MSSLTTLEVSNCDGLKYLLSSSIARSLVKLKKLKISCCKAMEEIVSTRESQNNIIYKLEILELEELPNLARFCTAGSCIEFPSLERLYMEDCSNKLGESTAKDTTFRREIQERELDENFQAHNETCSQNFLFDEKIRSPRLEILQIINYYGMDYKNRFSQTIWHNQLDPDSFCRLREVSVENCVNLRSIFPPSMMGRLSALETLDIKGCESMEVVFDERRETNVNETHGTSTTQLKDGQNLKSVDIYNCHRLKYIFPSSMVTGGLQQLQKMKAGRCDEMESVVAKEEGTLESTRHPNFVFPKVESMIFESMQRLKSFYPGMYISEWPLLKHFKFEGEVEIFAAELSVFQEKQMHAPTKQPFLLIDKVVMPILTTLEVSNCDGLKYLLSSSMARSLVKLKQLKISNCKAMEEIVSTRESQNNIISKLEILELDGLPNLARFCTAGSCIEFPSLERLYVRGCSNKLGESTAKDTTFRREIQERELDENFHAHNETSSQNFLFDEKIRSPRLEILQIINYYGMDYKNRFLQTIWHNQLDPDSFCRLREVSVENCVNLRSIFPPSMMGRLSALETLDIKGCESMEVVFDERRETNVNETHGTSTTQLKDGQNLKSVDIYNCHRLKYIFPASMVTGGLQQLQKMKAGCCDEMESVVAKEEGTLESTRHPNFVFPKVKSMIFEFMQRLKSFYPGMYISEWPLLKHFKFVREVEIFAAELLVFQEKQMHAPTKQPFLLIHKGSFPVLEKLEVSTAEILYGPSSSPVESIFSRLKYIHFWSCKQPCLQHAAVLFLQKLPNLEVLELYQSMAKIFVDERNGCGETVRVGSLPRVRVLGLSSVDVRHIGIENQPGGPVFPNLESLNVSHCLRLENLVSSAVSFQNLTTLEVHGCDGLKCLAPSSVAKSLVQLTNLTVRFCKEIVVLVAGNEDEDDDTENEIAFSRLQYLTLDRLYSLQGFCSRNCTAKLPLSITVDVNYCPIQLKISPDGVPIAESDEKMKMDLEMYMELEMEIKMQMEMEMQTHSEMEMRMGWR
ncbi:putative leucine-rich repeat domain, L domain-containing protein [Rosa chinensis]|uniref:Putative leucine-rich repeat domain, L domain-containing protein n=2 Tax=Rosa chinensis TaxID=74649 RepID=A0A2P6P7W4_ROSCH|nr:putative leucine-rich repeat domain, L domain-containing protein [Rosa chinensis]